MKDARRKIDDIDNEILALVNKRAALAYSIGLKKKGADMSHYVPEREADIINRLKSLNKGPLPGDAVNAIFQELISACRSVEGELKVGYLGPEATYTHQAAVRQFGSTTVFVPFMTIRDVFSAVNSAKVSYGVVPIENSNEGGVSYTLDMFIEWDLKISAECLIKVSHSLLSLSGNKSGIDKIYSHPQPIGQCREWLANLYPNASLIEVASTAKAAELSSADESSAAIASQLARKIYGLETIYEGIEDNPDNLTRFLVISNDSPGHTGTDKTSIIFSIDDKSGALCGVLKIFSDHGINLSKIESRPSKKRAWEYFFFVDVEGHRENTEMKNVIEALKRETVFLKILGSYPVAATQEG